MDDSKKQLAEKLTEEPADNAPTQPDHLQITQNAQESQEPQEPQESQESQNTQIQSPSRGAWQSATRLWEDTRRQLTRATGQITGQITDKIIGQTARWLPTDAIQLRRAYTSAQRNFQSSFQGSLQGAFQKDFLQLFNVSDEKIADILAQIRSELPTTEALLIGKPQAGKSSIVRGLTGVSAEIVGQGFRPHTQHTERYAYPSEDLPLLIFTDTVGLGDIGQKTSELVTELTNDLNDSFNGGLSGDLAPKDRRARILIVTVKITDFAVDQLLNIVRQLKVTYPNIPCLLAVTCLHEIYPPTWENHPSYPPEAETLDRAFAALKASFEGCFDRAVLLDFTLEEDGFDPVFYGQAALRDVLADLLPEAEAKAIYQLIDDQTVVSTQLGNLYRDVGRRYISAFAVIAATLAAVPLPFATMPVLTALQVSMVGLLGQLYGQRLTRSQAGGVMSAIAGGFFAQAIGRELIKFIPGFGSVIAASWAASYTWALGEGACAYFGDLMGGKKPDPARIQQVMAEAFEVAKTNFLAADKAEKAEKADN